MARAYGNSKIDQRTFSRKVERRRKLQAKAPPPRPIIDEENPVPDKYEGDIIFNKTIYSRNLFEKNIDIGEVGKINNFNGYLKDGRYYNRDLTHEEIKSL